MKTFKIPIGITKKTIHLISKKNKELQYFKLLRIQAYTFWQVMRIPSWANLEIKIILYTKILIYSIPKWRNKKFELSDKKILQNFKTLNAAPVIQNNIAFDIIVDSSSISNKYEKFLAKYGIIFCAISTAIKVYPDLVKKFLGVCIFFKDNFFAALNSSIFSDGSFCYIPQNIKCPLELSTYFRINNSSVGQFERTLIIGEKNTFVKYSEGCTAIKNYKNQLHAAIVELILFKNATIEYFTLQSWHQGNKERVGGIYNFVTKRGLCIGKNSYVSWTQVELGSAITWKYPSCVLIGKNCIGEFYSINLTTEAQQVDTGTKMIHLGYQTLSKIISKSILNGFSRNSYRGIVKFCLTANFSKNFSQCDSFLLNSFCTGYTYPYIDSSNCRSIVEHEAKISKLCEKKLFYLTQRGIILEQALNLLLLGFCQEITTFISIEFIIKLKTFLKL